MTELPLHVAVIIPCLLGVLVGHWVQREIIKVWFVNMELPFTASILNILLRLLQLLQVIPVRVQHRLALHEGPPADVLQGLIDVLLLELILKVLAETRDHDVQAGLDARGFVWVEHADGLDLGLVHLLFELRHPPAVILRLLVVQYLGSC